MLHRVAGHAQGEKRGNGQAEAKAHGRHRQEKEACKAHKLHRKRPGRHGPRGEQKLSGDAQGQNQEQAQGEAAALLGGIKENQLRQHQLKKKFHRLPPIKSDMAARKLFFCGREISSWLPPTVTLFLFTALTW